jgi:hypothetical protein
VTDNGRGEPRTADRGPMIVDKEATNGAFGNVPGRWEPTEMLTVSARSNPKGRLEALCFRSSPSTIRVQPRCRQTQQHKVKDCGGPNPGVLSTLDTGKHRSWVEDKRRKRPPDAAKCPLPFPRRDRFVTCELCYIM